MKKLVQRLVEINPAITCDKMKLQRKLDQFSKDGWEYAGQIGLFCVFKRWEEETKVYQPSYQSPNSTPYTPYGSNYQPYTPSSFGTPVYGGNNNQNNNGNGLSTYTRSPFDD